MKYKKHSIFKAATVGLSIVYPFRLIIKKLAKNQNLVLMRVLFQNL